jgi:hypothetical protein
MAEQAEALRLADALETRAITFRDKAEAAAELRRLHLANVKLVGALDMIRETLQGGNVDDLLYIINTALAEHRRTV